MYFSTEDIYDLAQELAMGMYRVAWQASAVTQA